LVASETQLRTPCFEVPFALTASHCAVQSRKAATRHRGNAPQPASCHAAFSDKGSRHHLLVRNTPFEDNILVIIVTFSSFKSATTLVLEQISELQI